MRFPLAIATCVGLALIAISATGQEADTPSGGRLLVFNGPAAQSDEGMRILRGSAVAPRWRSDRAEASPLGPGRWQAVAGERFWLFDRQSRRLGSCRNVGTANVGQRDIDCTFGTFSRFRRTFGNNFRH